MKTTLPSFSGKIAFLGLLLAAGNIAVAQTSAVTTTTSAGTVREFTPDTFTVASTSSATPVRYTYSKSTTYVDEYGNPVAVETVRSGSPVTVYYDRNGDRLMATKVVVRKTVDTDSDGTVNRETTTTTTSSDGTITSYNPDAIAVKSATTMEPVNYSFTKTTTYSDENGNAVSVETVKSGAPVTVYYSRVGDQMVASRVVVHRAVADPNATVIEHEKVTTTTTETNP